MISPSTIGYLAIFFFGTVWGSFFYTLALRVSGGNFRFSSLVTPSRCPSCGGRIGPLFLVPLLGYAAAGGKCAKCGARVSPLYPVMEILYGALAMIMVSRFGLTALALDYYLAAGMAISISVIDLKTLTVPGPLVAAFTLSACYPAYLHFVNGTLWEVLGGMLALGGFFLIILLVFPGSFGGGDLKFAAAIGLVVGYEHSLLVLELSLVAGAVAGIVFAAVTRKGLRIKIPFAPFLALGLIISLLYGRDLLLLYYRVLY